MGLNVYYGNKKVLVINHGDNQMAKDIVSALKSGGFNNVSVLNAPEYYADYWGISQEKPNYTIFVREASQCKVKTTKIKGLSKERLGKEINRDSTESRRAQGFYKHQLKLLKINPSFMGAVTIPLEDVRDIPWFYEDKSPMLHLDLPRVEGVPEAVVKAIKDYFRA